jgi:methylated-DNA-[protein]-cysteine S-methyltransferase
MTATHTTIDSPIGELTLVARDDVLSGVYFPGHWHMPAPEVFGARSEDGFDQARQQLGEYFAGERTEFELAITIAGEDFQRRVWRLIDRIPYGQTTTYGEMAQELGDPMLAREVGAAVGRNPLSIVVPVTGSSARTASSPATPAVSSASASCSSSREPASRSRQSSCSWRADVPGRPSRRQPTIQRCRSTGAR